MKQWGGSPDPGSWSTSHICGTGLWDIFQGRLQTLSATQPEREVVWAATHKALGWGCTQPLELTSQNHELQTPALEPQDLKCVLLGFGLALV